MPRSTRVAEALATAAGVKVLLRVGNAEDNTSAGVKATAYGAAIAEGAGWLADIALSSDDLSLLYTGGATGMPML